MRKKQLIEQLRDSQERVRQLEDLICPAESHEWDVHAVYRDFNYFTEEFESEYHCICKKCRKRKITSQLP